MNDVSVRLIFVNDGSRDNTLGLLRDYAEKYDYVKYISFSRNFGKEAAMLAGMKMSDENMSEFWTPICSTHRI